MSFSGIRTVIRISRFVGDGTVLKSISGHDLNMEMTFGCKSSKMGFIKQKTFIVVCRSSKRGRERGLFSFMSQ